jgi:hypothetical protein
VKLACDAALTCSKRKLHLSKEEFRIGQVEAICTAVMSSSEENMTELLNAILH